MDTNSNIPAPAPALALAQGEEGPITYSLLGAEEFELLEPIFKSYGLKVPDPTNAGVAGAWTSSGELVGFYVLQVALHAEPCWIDPAYRTKVSVRDMYRLLEEPLEATGAGPVYVLLPEDPKMIALAKSKGFEQISVAVLRKIY